MPSTSDKPIILITGSSTGIGLATVQSLLTTPNKPSTIIITSRSLDKATQAVQSLRNDPQFAESLKAGGSEVVAKQLDIDDEQSINKLYEEIEGEYGRLDVLVNNAAAHHDFDIPSGKLTVREAFLKSFQTNVISTYTMTETFVPLLLKSSTPRLIFLSSGIASLGDHSNPHSPVNKPPPGGWPKEPTFSVMTYRTSKTGMNMMILEWCRILRNDNVIIHILDPGFLATTLGGANPEELRNLGAQDPSVGGDFIRSVIHGERDEEREKLVGKDGVLPW